MDRVLNRLFIGSSSDLDGRTPLRELGFKAILDLRDTATKLHHVEATMSMRNRDGDPWTALQVHEAMKFIDHHIHTGKVLVACGAGQSRSASMIVGYLVNTGWSTAEAFAHLKAIRPQIAPAAAMLNSVLRVVVVR